MPADTSEPGTRIPSFLGRQRFIDGLEDNADFAIHVRVYLHWQYLAEQRHERPRVGFGLVLKVADQTVFPASLFRCLKDRVLEQSSRFVRRALLAASL